MPPTHLQGVSASRSVEDAVEDNPAGEADAGTNQQAGGGGVDGWERRV